MTNEALDVAPQHERHASQATSRSTPSDENSASSTTASAASAAATAVTSVFSAIPRLFKGSALRRPSKIPRLAKQQSSVSTSSTTNGESAFLSVSSRTAAYAVTSSAVSVTSAVSSRETTPFSSPSRRPSRLREPKQVVGRKRSRDETSVTIASVAERLRQQEEKGFDQQHSEDLSTVTTHDDATSQVSMSRDDESESVVVSQATMDDEDHNLKQQVTIARALQRDLLRDRARLRLRISAMKEDVETYYELLARMEQVTVAAAAQHTEGHGDATKRDAVLRLATRIQEIISARSTENGEASTRLEETEIGPEEASNDASLTTQETEEEIHAQQTAEEVGEDAQREEVVEEY